MQRGFVILLICIVRGYYVMEKILEMISQEIEARAAARAAEMFAEMVKNKRGALSPELPADVAPNGQIVRPFCVNGEKFLTRKDAATLLGIDLPALWNWTEKKKIIEKHKVGSKVYYRYNDVVEILNGRKEVLA